MLHIVNKIKEKPKILFICVGLVLLLFCIFLNFIYRPYAYSRHLSDFHISDSYTSFLGVPMGVCFIQGCLRAHKQQSIVGSILESMLILIGFEFVDAFFTKNIDWIDISAACLGGFFTYIIYYYLKKHYPIK